MDLLLLKPIHDMGRLVLYMMSYMCETDAWLLWGGGSTRLQAEGGTARR